MLFSYFDLLDIAPDPLPIPVAEIELARMRSRSKILDHQRAEMDYGAHLLRDPLIQIVYAQALIKYRSHHVCKHLKAKNLYDREPNDPDVRKAIEFIDRMPINHHSPEFERFFEEEKTALARLREDAEVFSRNLRELHEPIRIRSVFNNFSGRAFWRYMKDLHGERHILPYLYPLAGASLVSGVASSYMTMPAGMPQRELTAAIIGTTAAAATLLSRHVCAAGGALGAWTMNSLSRVAYGSFHAITKHKPENFSDKRFVASATIWGGIFGLYLSTIPIAYEARGLLQDVLEQDMEGFNVEPISFAYKYGVVPGKAGVRWVVRNMPPLPPQFRRHMPM